MRKITWRVRERNRERPALPRAWKKLVTTRVEQCKRANTSYDNTHGDSKPKSTEQSVIAFGTIIITDDRLHALADTDDDEYKDSGIAIEHDHSRHSIVAAILEQRGIDDSIYA